MGIIEAREFDAFLLHIHPDVHLGEVGEGKDPEVLARLLSSVEEIPKLGTLVFGVPFAEVIPMRKETLFGTGFFLIPSPASKNRVILLFFDGLEKGHGLKFVAGGVGARFLDSRPAVN